MAENEYLDISSSQRWHRVYDAVRDGKPIDEIVDLFEISLRKVIKNLRKPLYAGGPPQVPLGDLLNAFEHGPGSLDDVVRQCHGHGYAMLFRDASSTDGDTICSCHLTCRQSIQSVLASVFLKLGRHVG
jgi:hypothetical protein